MKKVLDSILLSDNVCEEFYKNYKKENFKKWILNLLPEIENCRTTKQDNPWHIYNCLDHILHSVENINKQTKNLPNEQRKMLAYVMFLHDMGKPECYLRRYSKLYRREVDSFFGHNKKSVEIAQRVLPILGFGKNSMLKILQLIEDHDKFMFLTLENDNNVHHRVLTQSVVDELVNKYDCIDNGKEMVQELIMVGRADSLAQNPEMTAKSFKLLDKMQAMANGQEKAVSKE